MSLHTEYSERKLSVRPSTESANLDFLRAYAVLFVYFGHLLQTLHITSVAGRITIFDIAQTGVLIFFVHTSLVLMLSLERLQVVGWRLFACFYVRRVFRIYPLSVVTVLAMIAGHVPAFPTQIYSPPGWPTLLSNLTLTQNLSGRPSVPAPLWSLPFEVQMYVVLPFIFVTIRRFRALWIPFCLWILDAAAIALMAALKMKAIPALLLFTPCFLSGVIGYRLWSEARLNIASWVWPIAITLCVGLRAIAEAAAFPFAAVVGSAWLACLLLGLAIPQFRDLRPGLVRNLAAKIAKYSYGIYLSQCAVFWIAFVLLKHESIWAQTAVCAVLSISVPIVFYHGVEKPMIELGARAASVFAERPKRVGDR